MAEEDTENDRTIQYPLTEEEYKILKWVKATNGTYQDLCDYLGKTVGVKHTLSRLSADKLIYSKHKNGVIHYYVKKNNDYADEMPEMNTINIDNTENRGTVNTNHSNQASSPGSSNTNSITDEKKKNDTNELYEPYMVWIKEEDEDEKKSGKCIYLPSNSSVSLLQIRTAIYEQWNNAPKNFNFINQIGVPIEDKQEKFAAFQKEKKIILLIGEENDQINNTTTSHVNNHENDRNNSAVIIPEQPLNARKRKSALSENKVNKKANIQTNETKERCGKPTTTKDHHPCNKYKPCPYHTEDE